MHADKGPLIDRRTARAQHFQVILKGQDIVSPSVHTPAGHAQSKENEGDWSLKSRRPRSLSVLPAFRRFVKEHLADHAECTHNEIKPVRKRLHLRGEIKAG